MAEFVFKTWRAHRNLLERLTGLDKVYETEISDGNARRAAAERRDAPRSWLRSEAGLRNLEAITRESFPPTPRQARVSGAFGEPLIRRRSDLLHEVALLQHPPPEVVLPLIRRFYQARTADPKSGAPASQAPGLPLAAAEACRLESRPSARARSEMSSWWSDAGRKRSARKPSYEYGLSISRRFTPGPEGSLYVRETV